MEAGLTGCSICIVRGGKESASRSKGRKEERKSEWKDLDRLREGVQGGKDLEGNEREEHTHTHT